jgi:hypothetical protein
MYRRDKDNDNQVKLYIPALVLGQIQCITKTFDTEVSWYGDITVSPDQTTFGIERIYLFPQVVTGGTFRTDTKEIGETYDAWYSAKLDEATKRMEENGFFQPIMQYNGHSHVSSPVNPSTEDMRFRETRGGINIYSIHNKSGSASWEIWTDEHVYEDDDISIVYTDDIFTDEEMVIKPAHPTHPPVPPRTLPGASYHGGSYWDRSGYDIDPYGVDSYKRIYK